MIKCNYCGTSTNHKKYCSKICAGHINGKISGKVSAQKNKERGTNFWDRKVLERCWKTQKERGLGVYNPKVRELGRKASIISERKNKTGRFDSTLQSKCGKLAVISNRKNGTGMYHDKKIQSRAGKIGGKITHKLYPTLASDNGRKFVEHLKKKSKHVWEGVPFLSKLECACAKKILTVPIMGINCHIPVGTKTIDFYPQPYDKMFQGCFVEFHPNLPFIYPNETPESYYAERRKALDNNGLNDKKLIVIQSLKELEKC